MTYQDSQKNVLDTPVNAAFKSSGKALTPLLSPQAPGRSALLWDDAEDCRDTEDCRDAAHGGAGVDPTLLALAAQPRFAAFRQRAGQGHHSM